MNRYSYDGPVVVNGKVATQKWHGETCAPTAAKAKSNLMYQWKKEAGYWRGIKAEMPGKVKLIEEDI